jgi:hypothetical protein
VPFVGGRMPVALGANEAPALLDVSSSASAFDATGDAETVAVGAVALADVGAVALADVGAVALAEGLVEFAATSGVAVVPCGVVEPDPQPATRRTTTRTTDARARNRKLDRKRATSPASAFFVAGDAEPILGSNPRQDLLPIGIGPTLSPITRSCDGDHG